MALALQALVAAAVMAHLAQGLPSWRVVWRYQPHLGPARRAHHTAVALGDHMIVFAGHSNSYELLDDTWSFNFNTSTWTQVLSSSLEQPGPRAGHAAAISVHGEEEAEMLVFGGLVPDQSPSRRATTNELWSMRVVNGTAYSWTLLKPEGDVPSPRWGATLVQWERAQKAILFGGLSVRPVDQYYESNGDLWVYDLRRAQWSLLLGTGMSPLQGRFSHAACLVPGRRSDGGDDRLVVYGGERANDHGTTTLGDLWTLNLGTMEWNCVACESLFERSEHSMVAKDGRVLAFGGYSVQNSPYIFGRRSIPMIRYVYDDLLVGDLENDIWYEFMSDENPSNRFALSAVVWRDEVVIYGGVMERHASDMYAIKVDSTFDSQLVTATRDVSYFPLAMMIFGTTNLVFAVLAMLSIGSFVLMFLVRRQSRYQRTFEFDIDEELQDNATFGEIILPMRRRRKNEGLSVAVINSMPLVNYEPGPNVGNESPVAEACAVCLVDFARGEELRVLQCCHRYHKECVDPWLLKNRLCPMCKRRAVDDATLAASQLLEEGVGDYDGGQDQFEEPRVHSHSMVDTTRLSEGEILLAEREDAWNERSRETRFILAVISAV